jgi:leucyl aminopeptidase
LKFVLGEQSGASIVIYPVLKDRLQSPVEGLSLKEFMGDRDAVTMLYGRSGETDVLVVGLGESAKLSLEAIRTAAGTAGRAAEKEKAGSVEVRFDAVKDLFADGSIRAEDALTAWVEGWLLGTYSFDKHKSKKSERYAESVAFRGLGSGEALEAAVKRGELRAGGTILARDLANEPPNHLRPLDFARIAVEYFGAKGVQVRVYQDKQLEEHQMNGIIAVGKGSKNPPALIEMQYCTDPSKPRIALVGKGITFDTGGISLKSGRDLSDMRIDMGGAAAVFGALDILVRSGQAVNVVALIATAENMPDGGSLLPGEVIRYANDVTVQVKNTDAEGRLVLADALIHAHRLGAVQVLDIATLTGACAAALGKAMAGVWGTGDLPETLRKVGDRCGDRVWIMPLEDSYEEALKSHYADVANISTGPYAGAITAALFLRRFVDASLDWAHIDIAGPMDTESTKGYLVAGATGYGARLLADYVIERSQ